LVCRRPPRGRAVGSSRRIFDLAPIALGVLNDKLSLDADEIAALSPLTHLAEGTPPLRSFVGANELPELERQLQVYAQAARARGLPCSLTTLPEHHHFSILDELSDPGGALTRALMELIMTSAK
jgi:arylformamidase